MSATKLLDNAAWMEVFDNITNNLKDAVVRADEREMRSIPLNDCCRIALPTLEPWEGKLKELKSFLERVEQNSLRAQADLEASEQLLRDWAGKAGALRRRLGEMTERDRLPLGQLDESAG